MHDIHNLKMGPMIGHTTPSRFRVWGRVENAEAKLGVIRYRPVNADAPFEATSFDFFQSLDGIGVVDINAYDKKALNADQLYEFEIGWTAKGVDLGALNWRTDGTDIRALAGHARTYPAAGKPISFLFGSCRDPIPPGDQGESTFESMCEILANHSGSSPQFCLMLGDQIYSDHMRRPVDKDINAVPLQHYLAKYRRAFSLPRFAELTRQCPTYMMLDDHEIQNNWTLQKFMDDLQIQDPLLRKFNMPTLENGLQAYLAYQESLGPCVTPIEIHDLAQSANVGSALTSAAHYFKFDCGNSSFFVLDTRGESKVPRSKNQAVGIHALLSEVQMNALKNWLSNDISDIKFIASGIPLCPDTQGPMGEPSDKWAAGAAQRKEILDFIWDQKIKGVVFLGGDVHVSYAAKITRDTDETMCAYVIVSSAFNWVLPGLQWFHFAWGPIKVGSNNTGYQCSPLIPTPTNIITRNNFALVKTASDSIELVFHRGSDGSEMFRSTLSFR